MLISKVDMKIKLIIIITFPFQFTLRSDVNRLQRETDHNEFMKIDEIQWIAANDISRQCINKANHINTNKTNDINTN